MQPDNTMEVDDLSDDFYELTVDEVRRLYHGLQQERMKLENKPLLTSTLKQENEQKNIEKVLRSYKHAVVRIQFPNGIILQGVFAPTDTIQNVVDFLKQYLETPDKPFDIFTTPVTEKLDTSKTLLEANFVPCVLMHFKWLIDSKTNKYLKSSVYSNMTSGDAASLLASKYRSPCIQNRIEEPTAGPSRTSTSSNSKVPKWFRNKD